MSLLDADVVIVGGAGFIGRAVAATLISKGKSVRIITRKRERAKLLWTLRWSTWWVSSTANRVSPGGQTSMLLTSSCPPALPAV